MRSYNTVQYAGNRWWLALIISVIVFSGFAPLVGVVIARSSFSLFADIGQFGAICLVMLHIFLEPVNFMLVGMLLAGLIYATWDRVTAWRNMRTILGLLPDRQPVRSEILGLAAEKAEIPLDKLHVVPGLPNPAFTVGFWDQKVYVSESLAEILTFPQLVAVLKHEAVHVARRDPLRLSAMRFLSCMLFWIPALRRLSEDIADHAEFYADSKAAGNEPLALASALVSLAKAPDLCPSMCGVSVGFTRQSTIEKRVRALLGEKVSFKSNLTGGSICSALIVTTVMWASGIVISHPLPESVQNSDVSIRGQIQCIQALANGSADECPHLSGL